jgi:hypothetical protein
MKNLFRYSCVFLLILFFSTLSYSTTCNKFIAKCSIQGNYLYAWLDTDLPDDTEISFSVSRQYYQDDRKDSYSYDYFSETSKVDKWGKARKILLDEKKWMNELSQQQKDFAETGISYKISRVDKKHIYCAFQVLGTAYGDWSGKAVKVGSYGTKGILSEVTLLRNIDQSNQIRNVEYANYLDLKNEHRYILSRRTPLMPYYTLEGSVEANKRMEYCDSGSIIAIIDHINHERTLWYKVRVDSKNNTKKTIGWINSKALIGQSIRKI